MGFYISDFSDDAFGFVVSDLDELIRRGTITVSDEGAAALPRKPGGAGPGVGSRGELPACLPPASAVTQADRRMEIRRDLGGAMEMLVPERARPIIEVAAAMPNAPGLYAIYGSPDTWLELGLGEPPDGRPLYVGKAEESLASRDINTHFGSGRTGSSTVRRSFAALLRSTLDLRGRPRNPDKPERFANYGLSPAHDRVLTEWMLERLELAFWEKPDESESPLDELEKAVLAALRPPLNLKDVATPWSPQVRAARKVMADQARKWVKGS